MDGKRGYLLLLVTLISMLNGGGGARECKGERNILLAALIDVNYAIKVIQGCGRQVPRHLKCGSLNVKRVVDHRVQMVYVKISLMEGQDI
ncbi:Protein kinase byr2 [Gossypium australe]|uniref:Protein kinase byr2 n=1 Tax=Gossypium australe TaxID=47621 RepID=A0A5B6X1P3_9ROSI|nr:Protein kinase byr2 [Gossypium australe]